MIEVTPNVKIKENELHFEFFRGSGPGGQNVNKVSTAVRLSFDVNSSSLSGDVRFRLRQLAGKRITENGVLLIEASQFRTQEQNREEAIRRLIALIRRAAVRPKPRKKTKPTPAAREERMSEKRKRGEIKKNRRIRNFE
jgi:ribosome-associated protein